MLFSRIKSSRARRKTPSVPPGTRVYAIGDVHGRLDLLEAILRSVELDDRTRGPADTRVVMLGDLIDRGPHSGQILEYLSTRPPSFATFHFLAGNHEQAMVESLEEGADPRSTGWLKYGGLETLLSYGVPADAFELTGSLLRDEIMRCVPDQHIDFLRRFEDMRIIGDYLFVHAGIRPGKPLNRQKRRDLLWIRDSFLNDETDHGYMVVHGHTITPEPVFASNRIGLDTGAYMSGVLTALGLEGSERWILQEGQEQIAAA
jgi:serine/threonine protein phosphatase 1